MILVLRASLVAALAAGVLAVGGCSSSPCCPPRSTFPGFLHGVSAASATDAWAVGDYAPPGGRNYTLILHWNATAWSRVPSPSPGLHPSLLGVSATSATSAWAVGDYPTPAGTHTLIMHWNGTAWSKVPSPSPARRGAR